jgi:hypothetical protein
VITLHYFIAFAGIWMLGNGILHDLFILREGRPFEKELIRLLIDGHILIFSGILYLICYSGIQGNEALAYLVSMVVSIFLLGYCGLILKMLPAIGIIVINVMVLVWVIVEFPGA